jgi:hypothetical protein
LVGNIHGIDFKEAGFCKRSTFGRVFLWTFFGLDSIRYLYEKQLLVLCLERDSNQWGKVGESGKS